jgi:hypothetical protein
MTRLVTPIVFFVSSVLAHTAIARPTPSPQQEKPANWNSMGSQQQAWWLCRDDPERWTARCKMVIKEATATKEVTQSHPSNWNRLTADQQATWTRLAPKTWSAMTSTEQVEWKDLVGLQRTIVRSRRCAGRKRGDPIASEQLESVDRGPTSDVDQASAENMVGDDVNRAG